MKFNLILQTISNFLAFKFGRVKFNMVLKSYSRFVHQDMSMKFTMIFELPQYHQHCCCPSLAETASQIVHETIVSFNFLNLNFRFISYEIIYSIIYYFSNFNPLNKIVSFFLSLTFKLFEVLFGQMLTCYESQTPNLFGIKSRGKKEFVKINLKPPGVNILIPYTNGFNIRMKLYI